MPFSTSSSPRDGLSTHAETLAYLRTQKFKVIGNKVVDNVQDALAEIRRLGEERAELPYDMDGAVVKLNSLTDREILGSTSKVPRWAIAYKYPPEEKGDPRDGHRRAGGAHGRADAEGGL